MAQDDQVEPSRPATQLTPSEKFHKYFQHEAKALQDQIDRISTHSTTGGERADAIDHCLAGIAHLSNEVHDAAASLPAYDQRTYGESIKSLSAKLQSVRSTVAPKPKFSFRSAPTFNVRKNASAISINDAAELANQRRKQALPGSLSASSESSMATTPAYLRSPAPEPADGSDAPADDDCKDKPLGASSSTTTPYIVKPPLPSLDGVVKIGGRRDQYLGRGLHAAAVPPASLSQPSPTPTTATLTDLSSCVVDLAPSDTFTATTRPNPWTSLTVNDLNSSLVLSGPIAGAAHITSATNSILVIASRQFRMHGSSNCDVYLSTQSRPIIEDCTGIRFAPLPEIFSRAWAGEGEGEEKEGGSWKDVDDFNWLRREASPNWRVLELGERVGEEVWRNVVCRPGGGAADGFEAMLKAVGVQR